MASSGLSTSLPRLRLGLLKKWRAATNNVSRPLVTSAAACSQQKQMIEALERKSMENPMGDQTTINKAAHSYLERVRTHEIFMAQKVTEFDLGRRHLANMMGLDHATLTQDDINSAISYLLPCGLFEPRARPKMLHPEKVFQRQKEAQFDMNGRPFHPLFYTLKPHLYQAMHDISGHMIQLDNYEDQMLRQSSQVEVLDRLNIDGSIWFTKEELERQLMEELNDGMYDKFILAMSRLCSHPYAHRVKDFIMQFRTAIKEVTLFQDRPQMEADESGRQYAIGQGTRKTCKAVVKVLENGNGYFNINGESILYFKLPQDREQLLLPLQVCGLLKKVDVICEVDGGGTTGQSGAIRYAMSFALQAFVDEKTIEAMRLSGLLTLDRRRIERKKPGQPGARAKQTWRKR